MAVNIYGLKNCDTCRKAIKWAEAESYSHAFKDLRADGFSSDDLKRWLDAVGLENLVNKRSTTWRGLEESIKENLNMENVLPLLEANPTLIKRPVFDFGEAVIVGFTKKQQEELAKLL